MPKLGASFRLAKRQLKAAYSRRENRLDQGNIDSGTSNPPTRAKTERPQSAREKAPPDCFPGGIKILYDCPGAVLDICFVHGLTGDRDSTWTARGQSVPWPKTLLSPRLAKASILTYGYDAYVVRGSGASVNGLISHAANLLNDLTTDRVSRHASNRPLLFVAHSLGGLLCKEAILLSRNHPESHLRGVFNCTKGVVFMGTPHGGSWMAKWASIPASLLGVIKSTNKSLLEILKTDDQFLESIQFRFLSMVRELREAGGRFEITCFFEELPLPKVGIVVSRESATLQGYSSFSIHADHRNMVRFRSAEDNGFVRLLGELTRWELQIRESAMDPSAWPAGEAPADTASTSLFYNYGWGNQHNAPGGTQYNNTGSGNQFIGDFSGPVSFS